MKRTLLVLAIATLALPATSLAKGPSEASIKGPGLNKTIKITGPEQDGSPMMNFAGAAGFFPGAFGQEPSPLLPSRPKGDLGPKYTVEYTVPGGYGATFHYPTFRIKQDLWPYAKPYAVTYMAPGQDIFDTKTKGGWYTDSSLKDMLVAAGLPKSAPSASTAGSSFPTGLVGGLLAALLLAAASAVLLRRRVRPAPAA
jgi:hypothetical protein